MSATLAAIGPVAAGRPAAEIVDALALSDTGAAEPRALHRADDHLFPHDAVAP